MTEHDHERITQIALELGKIRSEQCKLCNRRDELIDKLVMELMRMLDAEGQTRISEPGNHGA